MVGTRLHLLQGFALEWQNQCIELPVGMQRLVALLALRGAAHRSVVAGTLWPEVGEARALANLRTCIWRINRRLPGCIVSNGVGIGLRDMWIDCVEQKRITSKLLRDRFDEPDWTAEHLDILSRAELLPGWYDDWVIFERECLRQLRLRALEHAAVVLARDARGGAALQLALEAVRADPLRETANAALIEVYLAAGNVGDAIQHYGSFRRRVRHELGLEPSPAIGALLPRNRQAVPTTSPI